MTSHRFRPRFAVVLIVLTTVIGLRPEVALGQSIPSPEEFFGFQMGADRKLARWDKLVEYYELLGRQSARLEVVHMGPTTLGNPFLALFISSPDNLAHLEDLRQMNATLSDPRGASEQDIERAIADGKAVIVQSMGLHSSEVGASQMAAELMYDLVTRTDDEITRILDETIAIMIPCFNPDGEIMIVDWYNENVGTDYEGVGLPWLYHHYIGHDNNRDAFQQNTVESQYGAKILFRDWIPQAYIDHHQMGAYGARIYVPPYAEPLRPSADPLVWREMSWYGAHIAYKEEEAGKDGVVNAAVYSGWGHFGFHWITPFHNIAGMLTESASARLATPLFVHPDQLNGSRGLPEYEAQTTFPNPWQGGWWHVRDIVEQQKIAAVAALDIAARHRATVLRNAYQKASRQIERGSSMSPAVFVIPADQHDPLTATKMVNRLLGQGIDVHQAPSEFTHEGRVYGAGSFVVSMAQPKRGVIRWLLGRTFYPDNTYTRDRDGNPIRPYDMSTDTMAEFMGVRVDPADSVVDTALATVDELLTPAGAVVQGQFGYVLDGRLNDSFKAANLLLAENIAVRRVTNSDAGAQAGDFIVPASATGTVVTEIARTTGVSFSALDIDATGVSQPLQRNRIGMYQRYYGGNMDEGWTRWLLEAFAFPYDTLMDAAITEGNLRNAYDVIVLPADSVTRMTGESSEGGGRSGSRPEDYPPAYRSGFGDEGVAALEAFVNNGGTLVTFAQAGDLPIQKFRLPVRNLVAGLSSTEFWSPGSTLRVDINHTNPLAYGMPADGLAAFLGGNQVYEVVATPHNDRVQRIVTFIDRDILQSGWLLGEDTIAEKAAMVSVQHGQGRVVLIGFRAQHRAQTHGTFKLVFNALMGAGVP
ncbi:MAG: peptidase M14 family protein [Acidobacteria bacterium]|nr:peptidase M14 family protein [Acidobacteriota bacterium]MBF85006.1 peptidase M14 family protein [Acidobacteriota bacterium]